MRKIAFIAAVLFVVLSSARGTLIVYDPVNHATNISNEIVNFAKWAETEVQAAETQLNTLNTYEQQVLQVERMGDPKTLTANLPGVANLQTLSQIFTQGEKDVTDWAAFVNPQSWKMTAESIMNVYGQPAFNGFTASNGVHVGAAQSLFQFSTANYNTAAGAQQTVQRLTQQLQTQTQQLAAATASLQAATTTADVQKYQGVIAGLHSAITATQAALEQAKFSQQLQTQQNNSAQQITREMQAQQTEAEDLQAIDQGLTGLPVGQMNQPILWGSQP